MDQMSHEICGDFVGCSSNEVFETLSRRRANGVKQNKKPLESYVHETRYYAKVEICDASEAK